MISLLNQVQAFFHIFVMCFVMVGSLVAIGFLIAAFFNYREADKIEAQMKEDKIKFQKEFEADMVRYQKAVESVLKAYSRR